MAPQARASALLAFALVLSAWAPAAPLRADDAPATPAPAPPAPTDAPPAADAPAAPEAPVAPAPASTAPASAPTAPPTTPERPRPAPYVPGPTQAADLALAQGVEQNLVGALSNVRRFSVSVLNMRRDQDGSLQVGPVGSGVIVSKNGSLWVITNVHVTAGNQGLEVVTYDGRHWRVTTEDEIPQYDFALLRFSEKPKGLKGVDVKASASQDLAEGAWVLATGNPFYLGMDGRPVCSLGCISGTDRILGGEYFYGNAIQHDAEVNPGNSGGPLWNVKGQLIGINGKIAARPSAPGAGPSNSGASFSIPIHQVSAFLDQLVKPADAQAGFLGIVAETATDANGNPIGARVTSFENGSPANQGAAKDKPLAVGDVITRITLGGKGSTVQTATDLTNAVVVHLASTKVVIAYRRGNKNHTWNGALGTAR